MLYRKAELDEHAVRELVLWIENDQQLYRMQEQIHRNMTRKMAQDRYDHDLAAKAFGWLAEAGAKSYAREFGGVWHKDFPQDVRRAVAEYFRDGFEQDVQTEPQQFEPHVFKKDVKKWQERYPQRGAAVRHRAYPDDNDYPDHPRAVRPVVYPSDDAYPRDVAEEVSIRRPDFAASDAIAAVLMEDPSLTADEVIAILDRAEADHRDEVGYERRLRPYGWRDPDDEYTASVRQRHAFHDDADDDDGLAYEDEPRPRRQRTQRDGEQYGDYVEDTSNWLTVELNSYKGHQTFIDTPEDIAWLLEVHLPGMQNEGYEAAVMYGNEDSPDFIELYWAKDPTLADTPRAFKRAPDEY